MCLWRARDGSGAPNVPDGFAPVPFISTLLHTLRSFLLRASSLQIPWSTTEEELQGVFAPFGVVHVEVQKTRSGRSLGRALVTLASADKAARAIGACCPCPALFVMHDSSAMPSPLLSRRSTAELKDYQVGEPPRAMLVKLDELA